MSITFNKTIIANTSRIFVSLLILLSIFVSDVTVMAQSGPQRPPFQPINEIPGLIDSNTATKMDVFFNAVFKYGIIVAGLLTVMMIAIGGLQYMSTDAISGKKEGKERITWAVLGLLIVLLSWLILNVINPDILSLRLGKFN